jgi:hypothetical protein
LGRPPSQRLIFRTSYGFFTVPSHDRLIRLPSRPLRKRLAPVRVGSKSALSHAVSVSSLPAASSPLKEQMRVAKWGRMMEVVSRDHGGNIESWDVKASKAHKLRRRVYKGIPDRWRSAAWEMLIDRYSRTGPEANVKLGDCYHEDLEKPSSYDIQIDLDVPRTISGHIMFRTRYGLGCVSVPALIPALSELLPSGNVPFSTSCTRSHYDAHNVATCRAWALSPQPSYATSSLKRFMQPSSDYMTPTTCIPYFPQVFQGYSRRFTSRNESWNRRCQMYTLRSRSI